jgi:hypothetical protein
MKKVLFLFALLLTFTFPVFAQETGADNGIPVEWYKWLGYLLVIYELAAKIVPTVKDYTIVTRAYKFLHWLLSYNNLKKD